jgi:O-antigen ligase
MIILPYMVGKLLIENGEYKGQPVRIALIRRMVLLLAFVAIVSVIDFLTAKGIWIFAFRHFFPGQNWWAWPTQIRWGFGRITGPFAHAILAGMVFLMGLTYCIWLRTFAPQWGTRKVFKEMPLTVRGLVLWAIVAGLLMTQSRGPWLGVILALLFVFLMRKFTVGRATVIFLLLAAAIFTAGYYYGNRYTEVQPGRATSEQQASAIYRRDLIRNYTPAVMERKAFGWGITTAPMMGGQPSIDNQYLMLAFTQGFTGLGLFVAILAGWGGRLLWLALRPMSPDDKGLVFAHLAVLIGLATALATVYLGEQTQLLFFLIVGWVQGMHPVRVEAGAKAATAPRFEFRRVLT